MELYVAGVIGETSGEFETERFIYELIYSIFFGLLFGNIVSGIIIAAFSTLREKQDELDEDKSNKCFICNKDRDSIEKDGDNFKSHINSSHFLWNYIFYAHVLLGKDKT